MIKLNNVKKEFLVNSKTVNAIKGITLEINCGETVAVCGPSGAGKSTILHIMGLMDKPTSGTVELLDTKTEILNERKQSELRNSYIGFVFQFHYLAPDFNVIENLMLPAMIKNGRNISDRKKSLIKLLDAIGVAGMAERYPSELSGGEQQRVALARALVNEPKIILADEPTGNLDSANSSAVIELMFRETRERNATLVIATHNMELAKRTQRIIYLKDGMIESDRRSL